MKAGNKVIVVKPFYEEQIQWPFIQYPGKDDILTIKTIEKHPHYTFYLLTFEELDTVPLCEYRFREIEETPAVVEDETIKETV